MASSLSVEEKWSEDQLLDFWNDPKNHNLIINAVPVGNVSMEELVHDCLNVKDEEFASQVIHAVPKDLDSDFFVDMIDKKKFTKLLETGDLAQIEQYFHKIRDQIAAVTSEYMDYLSFLMQSTSLKYSPTMNGADTNKQTTHLAGQNIPRNVARTMRSVPKEKLTRAPYQSVGLLYWPESSDEMKCATAFYVGNGKIVTAAHSFGDVKKWRQAGCLTKILTRPDKAIFVPAVTIDGDVIEEPYGRFIVSNIVFETSYEQQEGTAPFSSHNDICSATITRGEIAGTNERYAVNGEEERIGLRPLPLLPYNEIDPGTQERMWSVIGYKRGRDYGVLTTRMKQFEATEYNARDQQNDPREVIISPGASVGMSGGPWIQVGENEARGLQSGSVPVNVRITISRSPLITEDMLRDIELL